MNKKVYAVIVAAGSGKRFGSKKQYYPLLKDRTILDVSLDLFLSQQNINKIVVVADSLDKQEDRVSYVQGGATRAHSVQCGLALLPETEDAWVIVHDAVRCCLRRQELADFIHQVSTSNLGGFMAMPATDTMRIKQGNSYQTIDREQLYCAQTPQMFALSELKQSLDHLLERGIEPTDEAQAMQMQGFAVHHYLGYRHNIKITYPEDIVLARGVLLHD